MYAVFTYAVAQEGETPDLLLGGEFAVEATTCNPDQGEVPIEWAEDATEGAKQDFRLWGHQAPPSTTAKDDTQTCVLGASACDQHAVRPRRSGLSRPGIDGSAGKGRRLALKDRALVACARLFIIEAQVERVVPLAECAILAKARTGDGE